MRNRGGDDGTFDGAIARSNSATSGSSGDVGSCGVSEILLPHRPRISFAPSVRIRSPGCNATVCFVQYTDRRCDTTRTRAAASGTVVTRACAIVDRRVMARRRPDPRQRPRAPRASAHRQARRSRDRLRARRISASSERARRHVRRHGAQASRAACGSDTSPGASDEEDPTSRTHARRSDRRGRR